MYDLSKYLCMQLNSRVLKYTDVITVPYYIDCFADIYHAKVGTIWRLHA